MDRTSPATPKRGASRGETPKSVACGPCHVRKIKCDFAVPSCSNCWRLGKPCLPYEPSGRARPTHGKIARLEAQVRQLETMLLSISEVGPSSAQASDAIEAFAAYQTRHGSNAESELGTIDGPAGPAGPSTASGQEDYHSRAGDVSRGQSLAESAEEARSEGVTSRFLLNNNGVETSHGPTALQYDPANGHRSSSSARRPDFTDEYLRSTLTTLCIEERQKEYLNLAAGRLDFDGVEPELAMHLLALHWNRQHHSFFVSYRPAFMRDMASAGPYFSHLLLNTMYFCASKHSNRPEVFGSPNEPNSRGIRFLRRVKELLGQSIYRSSIPTIQSLLMLATAFFHGGEQSSPWIMSGIAFRMILDLGLHHDVISIVSETGPITPMDLEIRRRVLWSAFVLDKVLSLYLGRSVTIHLDQLHVPLHFFDDEFEENEQWQPHTRMTGGVFRPVKAHTVTCFMALCSLAMIMEDIIGDFYSDLLPKRSTEKLKSLRDRLDRWRGRLPAHLDLQASFGEGVSPPPHVFSVHVIYHTLKLLLHRPFVETGHLHRLYPSLAAECWIQCESAAVQVTEIIMVYRDTYTLQRAPYIIAYSLYVASAIHVRMASQRRAGSDAHRYLAVCLEGLEQNSHVNVGLRTANARIYGLMKKMGVSLVGEELGISPADPDLDAIIRSFDYAPLQQDSGGEPSRAGVTGATFTAPPSQWWPEQDNWTALSAFFGDSTLSPQHEMGQPGYSSFTI